MELCHLALAQCNNDMLQEQSQSGKALTHLAPFWLWYSCSAARSELTANTIVGELGAVGCWERHLPFPSTSSCCQSNKISLWMKFFCQLFSRCQVVTAGQRPESSKILHDLK
jgi:hypothetical protein